jgi:hypothetical protein
MESSSVIRNLLMIPELRVEGTTLKQLKGVLLPNLLRPNLAYMISINKGILLHTSSFLFEWIKNYWIGS